MAHPSLDDLKSTVLEPARRIKDVVADAPRLAHGVQALDSDRRKLLAAFDSVQAPGADTGRVEQFVSRVKDFRQRVGDLLYQAYEVDLGGET